MSDIRILLVDDEPALLDSMSLPLEFEGYRVTKAANGRRALDILAQQPHELMVTDFMMPFMDGAELVNTIRADPRFAAMPIVMLSAVDNPARRRVNASFWKPAPIDILLESIEELIANRQPLPPGQACRTNQGKAANTEVRHPRFVRRNSES